MAETRGPQALVGTLVGGYRLIRLEGSGASGAVFVGRRETASDTLPDEAAIKVLILPWQLTDSEREEFLARFRREAETLQRLQYPHIVPVLAVGEEDDFPYMVLPYLSGGTLASRLARGPLQLSEVARYAEQLAGALDYAHSLGIVHRDVKPQNILLDTDGEAYLADFSIARLLEETRTMLTSTGRVLGTPSYMAPEQIAGSEVTAACDIYSLGIVLYELVTGRVPFEGDSLLELVQRVALAPPDPPRDLRSDLPEPAEAAILQALAKRPEERFATAGAFARAFAAGVEGHWTEGLTPRPTGAAPRFTADTTFSRQTTVPDGQNWTTTSALAVGGGRRVPVWALAAAIGVLTLACIGLVFANGKGAFAGIAARGGTTSHSTQTTQRATATAHSGGGAPAATPTTGSGVTASGGPGATPTPTPTPTATASPTPLPDGATFAGESGFPTVDPGSGFSIDFVLQNAGGTTWTDSDGYALVCTSNCLGAGSVGIGGSVSPSQTHQFNINMTAPSPGDLNHTVTRTWWIMSHNGAQFGPPLDIDVNVRGFYSWYAQHRPYCDDGGPWQTTAATTVCLSNGLEISQFSNSVYAEDDLNSPNGTTSYSQTLFRVESQVGLLNPGDTSVWASLLVQTPRGTPGGFILAVNSQGNWKLQQITCGTCFNTLASGQVGINAGSFSMQIRVRGGQLYADINGAQVAQWGDGLSSGMVSLLEESPKATSSAILWSSFELDLWG